MFNQPCKHCGVNVGLYRFCPTCSFPISHSLQQAWLEGYNAPAGSDSPFKMIQVSPTEYTMTPGDIAWHSGQRRAKKEQAAKVEVSDHAS